MANVYGSCKVAIFNSKLYRSSENKEYIKSKLEDPINSELIEQLDEYIGDDYKSLLSPNQDAADEDYTEAPDTEQSEDIREDSEKSEPVTHNAEPPVDHHSGPKLSEKYGDALDSEMQEREEAIEGEQPDSDDLTEKAESSTDIGSLDKVEADTVVTKPFVENHVAISELAGEIKGSLNARSDTSGVTRASVKNNELWIYYNDEINLNNLMSEVIEFLSSANYSYLVFNRLARTDNAIVFTINSNDTDGKVTL